VYYALPVIIGYLLGSLNFSFLYGKLFKGMDIRKHGSGNAGATNTLRVLGKGPAIAVLGLDVGKGIAAVWMGYGFAQGELWLAVLTGLSAIIGHNWPVFFGFKGGKGIATTIGVMVTLSFLPTLLAGSLAIITILISRYVSLGSLVFAAFLPAFIWYMERPMEIFWASLVVAVFAYIRHRTNIVKLIQGKEHKLGSKNKTNAQ
jgi:glycerol-3-phosphate acyltransferase PlsY